MSFFMLFWIVDSIASIVPIIIAVAFYTLAERKFMAYLQRRVGPNVVGIYGLLQPVADGLKLIFKESILTKGSTPIIYTLACTFPFIFGVFNWYNIPFNEFSDMSNTSNLNLLYIFPVSIGGLAGVILAGWASNSKYSTLGAYRGISQLISYDVPMMFSILPIILMSGSLDLIDIAINQINNVWFFFAGLTSFFIFSITVLAETNRVPFDLPEAEAELVAGFNVEYSSINFALFFLGEYSNMLLLSAVTSLLFFSGTSENNAVIILFSISAIFVTYNYLVTVYKLDKHYNEIHAIRLRVWEHTNFLLKAYQLNIIYFLVTYSTVISYLYLMYGNLLILSNTYNEIYNIFCSITCFITIPVLFLPFHVKVVFISFLFILVRANVPRYRFDQLLGLSWKGLLPVSIASLFTSFSLLFCFNGFTSVL